MPLYILCETSVGVIPLPLEVVLLDEEAQDNLNAALKDSVQYLEQKHKESQIDIIPILQDSTKKFIQRLRDKKVPVLLLPK